MAFGSFGQKEKDAETPAGDAYGSDGEDDAGGRHRRTGGRAGYMQPQHQGARGKKRTSDTQGGGSGSAYERDREESRQAKIRKMAEDRNRSEREQGSAVSVPFSYSFRKRAMYMPRTVKPSLPLRVRRAVVEGTYASGEES